MIETQDLTRQLEQRQKEQSSHASTEPDPYSASAPSEDFPNAVDLAGCLE